MGHPLSEYSVALTITQAIRITASAGSRRRARRS